MEITFLGTGTSQGVPVIACPCPVCHSSDPHDKRLRTSALVADSDGNNILLDIGPDFRQQMLSHDVRHLEAILITHAHRDHVGGIDDIRPLNWVQHSNMEVYANRPAIQSLKHDYRYIFEPHIYPGLPEVTLHDVSDLMPFSVGRLTITPIAGMHKELPVVGYRIEEQASMPESRPHSQHPLPVKKMAYITDMNHITDREQQKLYDLDLLVINALRRAKHFSHFSLPESLEIIARCKPTMAYLTHMSHEMGFHAEVEPTLPSNVHLAFDGLKVTIV